MSQSLSAAAAAAVAVDDAHHSSHTPAARTPLTSDRSGAAEADAEAEAEATAECCEVAPPHEHDSSLELLRVEEQRHVEESTTTPRSRSRRGTLAFKKRKFAHCPADRTSKDSPVSKTKEKGNRSKNSAASPERNTTRSSTAAHPARLKPDPFSAFRYGTHY